MIKYDVKIVIFLLVIALLICDASPEWCSWLMKGNIGLCLEFAYDFLASHILSNCLCAIGIISIGGYYLWTTLRDRDSRGYRLALIVLCYVLLYVNNTLDFVPLTSTFDYRDLCGILFALSVLAMILKVIDRKYLFLECIETRLGDIIVHFKSTDSNDEKAGFPVDSTKSVKVPDALDKYAEEIARQLLRTDLSEQSFAVGITGEWGTGKTVFLNLLCSKLKGKAEIVSFNPWLSRTPEQVTKDFFTALEKQLSPRHSSLSKPLRDYAHDITNAAGSGWLARLSFLFTNESLQSKKDRLSNKFGELSKPVVVVVDDIDRMEGEEVFEVLRLIRNTADLKNTIYIAAYDRTYVTNVLDSVHILNSDAYLQKIFPVELHQPKVEDSQILQVLYDDLKKINFSSKFVPGLKRRIDSVRWELIARTLGNYRQARRFARQYLMNVSYIQDVFSGELSLLDLFWLELLQVYDKTVYDILNTDRSKLLDYHGDQYVIQSGISDEYLGPDVKKYKGEPIWKEETPKILTQIFGRSTKKSRISMCRLENYDKFFTLGVPSYRLSFSEYFDVFKHKGDEERIVKGWLEEGKYISSIFYQITNYDAKMLDNDDLKCYIDCILSFGFVMFRDYNNSGIGIRLRRVLNISCYKESQRLMGNRIIANWFEIMINKNHDHVAITKLLKELYQTKEYDENGHLENNTELLISNDEIEKYLQSTMRGFLIVHTEVTAKNVFEEETEMGKVFGNCCVLTEAWIINDSENSWKNVAIDVLVRHFESKPKLIVSDKEYILNQMFKFDEPDWDNEPNAAEIYSYDEEERCSKLNAYFGNDSRAYNRLINVLFVENGNQPQMRIGKIGKKYRHKKKN